MIMEMMKTIKIMAAASALLAFAGCVEEQAAEMTPAPAPGIRAVMENPEVRTSVDLSGLESGKVIPVLWNPGDALGAYTDGGSANVLYMNDEQSEDVLADGNWQNYFTECPAPLTAAEKREWLDGITGVALGSDAFFPFGDNIERARRSGVTYVAQPGGSIRDDNVIEACNKYGMAMAFTGMRLFHH